MMATKGQITEDTVYKVAGSVGLDVDRLKQDMSAPEIEQAIKGQSGARADALNIHGTPGFIIGNHIVPGALDLDRPEKHGRRGAQGLICQARRRPPRRGTGLRWTSARSARHSNARELS